MFGNATKTSKKTGIFVSYRRADTSAYAGRLVDRLRSRFGDHIFLDVESINAGANFQDVIRDTLSRCGVLLLLIGKKWIEREETAHPFGDTRDVITQEIQTALDLQLLIIPVVLDGASIPSESVLPPHFRRLPKLNAIELRHVSFDRDVEALTDNLEVILEGAHTAAIEKKLFKMISPFLGSQFRLWHSTFAWLAILATLWAVIELVVSSVVVEIQNLASASVPGQNVTHLQAVWTGAFAGIFLGVFGRRSVKWWRYATISIWISLGVMLLSALLVVFYLIEVPGSSVMDLFDSKA
jgi:hypothetical protein